MKDPSGPYSAYKAIHHIDRIEQLRRGEQTVPLQVMIVLSDLCSHACRECSYRWEGYTSNQLFGVDDPVTGIRNNNPNRMIPYEKAIEILDDCKEMGVKAIEFSVHGDERIPIIDSAGNCFVRPIGKFVDDLFGAPFRGGYEHRALTEEYKSFSVNDAGEIVEDYITDVYRHQANEDLYEVTLEDGRHCFVTASHSLVVVRGGTPTKIPICNLSTGDMILCANWSHTTKPNRQWKIGIYPNSQSDIIDESPELYRFLGYYMAEGSMYGEGKPSRGVIITFGNGVNEQKYIDDCVSCLKVVFGYTPNFSFRPSSTQIRVCATGIADFIRDIGGSGLCQVKTVPDIVWNASIANKVEFLTGYFAGDGNFRNTLYKLHFRRNTLSLKTSSRSMAQDVMTLLLSIGCTPTLLRGRNKRRKIEGRWLAESDYYSVSISNKSSLDILSPILEHMNSKTSYRLNALSVSGMKSKRKAEAFGAEAYTSPVKSIRLAKELGRPLVYDISVKNTHRFIVNSGITASNTGGGEITMHPRHHDVFKATLDRGLELALVSHGVLLRDDTIETLSRGSWVRISVDCSNEKTYSSFRRVPENQFHRAIENIGKLVNAREKNKSKLIVGVGFVVAKENFTEIYDAVKLFRDLGVDNVRISATFAPNNFEYHKDHHAVASELSAKAFTDFNSTTFRVFNNYGARIEDLQDSAPEYVKCGYMEMMTYIGGDLSVYKCCNTAYNEIGLIGSLKSQRFKDLWLSEEKKAKFSCHDSRGCPRCMFNQKNRFINYLVQPNPEHVNFI